MLDVAVGADLRAESYVGKRELLYVTEALQQEGPVLIDLRDCRRFDIVALLHVLAATAQRSDRDLVTRFRLPTDSNARDFLRMKRFPLAVRHVTQVPLRFLVGEEDIRYFGEPRDVERPSVNRDASGAILDYLSEQRFFSFRPYQIKSERDRTIAIEDESDHWRNPLLMRVLERRLDRDRDPRDFTRVVVQELLVGLLRHVSSGNMITASQLDVTQHRRHLTVAAWQGPTEPPTNFCERLYAHLRGMADRQPELFVLEPQQTLDTSDLSGRKPQDRSDNAFERGIGALYQYVINVFGGVLEAWSSQSHILLAGDLEEGKTKYRVRWEKYERHRLVGNIIAVRVPT